jgi:hypothetical protein
MDKRLLFLVIAAGLLLSAQMLESQDFPSAERDVYQSLLRTAYRFARFEASQITFFADGGGDGGGTGDGGTGDGGTGDGGTGDGGTDGTDGGDSASNGAADAAAAAATHAAATDAAATDAAATDAAATDAAAAVAATTTTANAPDAPSNTDPSAQSDQTNDDQTNNNAPPTDPAVNNTDPIGKTPTTDPSTFAVTPELAAIEAIPTTDPRGGEITSNPPGPGATLGPGGTIAPGTTGPTTPVDVRINAVIVSAAQSPWDAITKAPGVRNVIVTGGIIALGKTPIEGEIPGGGPQPAWLRLIPDLDLCSGKKIPPVVPNVIDIRIMNCPIKIEDSGE